jgi:endonuclease/exonuclease/phosphatase family metal-dependent hydrolase
MKIKTHITMILLTVLMLVVTQAWGGKTAQRKYVAVSYNCENLFDTRHDTLKNDSAFLPEGEHRWTAGRYWKKLNDVGRVILQCGGEKEEWRLPDIVGLVEVENDSVLTALTRRSMLRNARYNYVMTSSPDMRGVDVALLYNPYRLRLIAREEIEIPRRENRRPTRNILHATLLTEMGDSLHVFVVHAPSRGGGVQQTEGYRMEVAERLTMKTDSIRNASAAAKIIVMGDFNDYSTDRAIMKIVEAGLTEVSAEAKAKFHPDRIHGTYFFQNEWNSLDHIFATSSLQPIECHIHDAEWLLEEDKNGIYRPKRTFVWEIYHGGVSDHLPVVFSFQIAER